MRNARIVPAALCLIAAMGLTMASQAAVEKTDFGTTADGQRVELYTLTNNNGLQARISTFGAVLVSLKAPDRAGRLANIVLGFDNAEAYEQSNSYYGATIGRYANRIAAGHFTLDGQSYQLPINSGLNTLHGGIKGFHKHLWTAERLLKDSVKLTYVSADGEEGFPGALTLTVIYRLRQDNALSIRYEATTTKPTVINFTNHSYFNLSGNPETPITGETLSINADTYTAVDGNLIPTGEIKPVAGTPFDFRSATVIGARLGAADAQMNITKGYDLNWVLNKPTAGTMTAAAVLSDPVSGRVLLVHTEEPGLQFYSGNIMTSGGPKHPIGLCLETQHFPDSPNHANFPTTVLRPGETFHSETVLLFRTQ
ncbi:MAG: galactose mutarotase [Rhizomicrobium sp.]|nr:galactose mutarotase [Rhizomicrobium sp.]